MGPPADEEHAIDLTIVRAHQHAAGVKGGISIRKRSDARVADSRPKSTCGQRPRALVDQPLCRHWRSPDGKSLSAPKHRPGDPGQLVGERHDGDIGWARLMSALAHRPSGGVKGGDPSIDLGPIASERRLPEFAPDRRPTCSDVIHALPQRFPLGVAAEWAQSIRPTRGHLRSAGLEDFPDRRGFSIISARCIGDDPALKGIYLFRRQETSEAAGVYKRLSRFLRSLRG